MKIRKDVLPVLKPAGGKEEIQAVADVINSGWWGKGPKVEQFEDEFAKMVGHKYAVAVTSNSHGQDLIMKAMGFKGIDVINPAISFIATAMVPLWNDCTSNIVDVKRDTLCIDPEDVAKYKKMNSEVLISVDEAGVLFIKKKISFLPALKPNGPTNVTRGSGHKGRHPREALVLFSSNPIS